MNGKVQGYQHYRDHHWEDDASSSSAYDANVMSPYRGESRAPGPQSHHHTPHTPQLSNHPLNEYSSDPGSVGSGDDGPTYILEHLATFRVSPEAGLVFPADGMRRLLHMEKTTGIWTQKMMLKLDRKWVFILSHENGDVVEKFPLSLIREPTAFTSEDPKELYNNIFIFVVAEDPKRNYDNPTEMHIFQCLRISAKDVVEDMKMYMSGKSLAAGGHGRRARGGEHIPPPPQEDAPEPPMIANGYRDFSDAEVRGDARGDRSERSSVSHNDEASSTKSEKYERDVAILNNCFEDIERFIARLQHTAAATRELERRRRSRKSKKKDIGDGLLSMRAKPPPEREFVDIFQKFKLSFNLLAKLRANIRDPNAPELVHFLFTPLALIVDASRDSYFEPSLPPRVVSPLLIQDAIELLTNCLTSRETELWQSLGDPWLVPKEAWKYPVPPYRPVFYSGWAPEISIETRDRRFPMYPDNRAESETRRGPRDDFDYSDSERRDVSPPPMHADMAHPRYGRPGPHREERPRSMTPMSEFQDSADQQLFEKAQRKFFEEIRARGGKVVQVTYPRTANNDKELTVVRGEFLEVLDDSRKWWKAQNSRGLMAHVPHTIVTPYASEEPVDRRPPGAVRAPKKDGFTIDDSSSEEIRAPPITKALAIPPPPPTPPISIASTMEPRRPRQPRAVASKNLYQTEDDTHAALMGEELKLVLEDFRRTRPHLEVKKTPDVYINQKSTAEEVQGWLKMKNFTERIQKQFEGVDGGKLFSLSRSQLEGYCGKAEGSRMASQINVQRTVSGYKTARSDELKKILAKRRQETDEPSKVLQISTSKPDEENLPNSSKPLIAPITTYKLTPPTPPVYSATPSAPPKYFAAPDYETGPRDTTNIEAGASVPPPPPAPPRSHKGSIAGLEAQKVAENFQFLQNYETDGGGKEDYDTDSSDEAERRNKSTKKVTSSGGTLKEQIRNQHRKIVGQPNEVITGS